MLHSFNVHQGNGHEMICGTDNELRERVSIFDVYNATIYPHDNEARAFITYNYPLINNQTMQDDGYLALLRQELPRVLDEERPDLIIYNAGTDVLDGDRLGNMHITENGIIERDALVFRSAHERHIPIAMVLSGGYTQQSARIIGRSIVNIVNHVIQ